MKILSLHVYSMINPASLSSLAKSSAYQKMTGSFSHGFIQLNISLFFYKLTNY